MPNQRDSISPVADPRPLFGGGGVGVGVSGNGIAGAMCLVGFLCCALGLALGLWAVTLHWPIEVR